MKNFFFYGILSLYIDVYLYIARYVYVCTIYSNVSKNLLLETNAQEQLSSLPDFKCLLNY